MMTRADDTVSPTKPMGNVNAPYVVGGLTKREWFAGLALQGVLSENNVLEMYSLEELSSTAVQTADALITELNKDQS